VVLIVKASSRGENFVNIEEKECFDNRFAMHLLWNIHGVTKTRVDNIWRYSIIPPLISKARREDNFINIETYARKMSLL
jgi:hypothetical protein